MSIQPVGQPAPPPETSSNVRAATYTPSEEVVSRPTVAGNRPVQSGSSVTNTKDLQNEMTEAIREAVQEAAQRVSEAAQNLKREIRFNVDEGTGRFVITVINATTEEIVRQIPSEEFLKISRNLDEAMGLILKTEA